ATPYMVPSFDANLIFESTPPDPELVNQVRLPFERILVLFTHPLRFRPDSGWLGTVNTPITDYDRGVAEGLGIAEHVNMDTYRQWTTHGGAVVGMLLTDDGTGVSDWTGWIITTATDDNQLINPTVEFGR